MANQDLKLIQEQPDGSYKEVVLADVASAARAQAGLGTSDTVEFGAFISPSGTTAVIDAVTDATVGQVMIDSDRKSQVRFISTSGYEEIGGLSSSAAVQVSAGASPTANGIALAEAYTAAKALTPNGAALSSTNRATLLVGSGVYTLAAQFNLDAEFVDIQAINFNPSVKKDSVRIDTYAISVSANDILISGLIAPAGIAIVGVKPLQVYHSCSTAASSFSGNYVSGTFVDCVGGDQSFGGPYSSASGTFTRCVGGNQSFGGGNYASAGGTFVDCVGGDQSFGYGNNYSSASGTFTRCVGGDQSFGGGNASLTGTLINCQTTGTFQTVSGSGKTRLCLDGTLTENNQG